MIDWPVCCGKVCNEIKERDADGKRTIEAHQRRAYHGKYNAMSKVSSQLEGNEGHIRNLPSELLAMEAFAHGIIVLWLVRSVLGGTCALVHEPITQAL